MQITLEHENHIYEKAYNNDTVLGKDIAPPAPNLSAVGRQRKPAYLTKIAAITWRNSRAEQDWNKPDGSPKVLYRSKLRARTQRTCQKCYKNVEKCLQNHVW